MFGHGTELVDDHLDAGEKEEDPGPHRHPEWADRPITERKRGTEPKSSTGPVLNRLPRIDFIDDKAGKPVAIHKFIGRRPIAAFGNSDGDLQMLQWTDAGDGARLMVIVHHTDDRREWAYDRDSHIGRLDRALDEADRQGWTIVDMKRDWRVVYPQ